MPLDKVIRSKANQIIDKRMKDAELQGTSFSVPLVAKRMASWLATDKKTPTPSGVENNLRRYLGISKDPRYIGKEVPWSVDYVEAFSHAVSVDLSALMDLEIKDVENLEPLDWAIFLGKFLRRNLSDEQVALLKEQIVDARERPGGIDLFTSVFTVILEESDPHDAAILIGGILAHPNNAPFFAATKRRSSRKRASKK